MIYRWQRTWRFKDAEQVAAAQAYLESVKAENVCGKGLCLTVSNASTALAYWLGMNGGEELK